jgi:hypothetical protein
MGLMTGATALDGTLRFVMGDDPVYYGKRRIAASFLTGRLNCGQNFSCDSNLAERG